MKSGKYYYFIGVFGKGPKPGPRPDPSLIPVYKSRIQSLHVFFSLYSAFKHSQHFNLLANEDGLEFDENNQMLL